MPGLVLLRAPGSPPLDPPLPHVEVIADAAALLERLERGGAGIRAVALDGDLEDVLALSRSIRASDPTVGIILLPEASTAGTELLDTLERLAALPDEVAQTAHDMGTPLNTILGYAELLEKSAGDAKSRKRAATIATQVESLSQALDRLVERLR